MSMDEKSIFKRYLNDRPALRRLALSGLSIVSQAAILVKIIVLNLFVRPFLRRPKYDKRYKISICGIFKNEALFLKEWIEYHEMIGVEHFYLYNNDSDDHYKDVLQPYIDRGLVTLTDWPYLHGQMKAYRHFYENYRHETQWVSFLDLDEFICPKDNASLSEWLQKQDRYPVILFYWKIFGTSNIIKHDYSKLVIEQYFLSWKHFDTYGKCIVNTDYDIARYDGHTHHETALRCKVAGIGFILLPMNVFGHLVSRKVHFGDCRRCDEAKVQINHYQSMAWDVYDKKRKMPNVFFKDNPRKSLNYFYNHEERCNTSDYSIFRFLIRLKNKMNII